MKIMTTLFLAAFVIFLVKKLFSIIGTEIGTRIKQDTDIKVKDIIHTESIELSQNDKKAIKVNDEDELRQELRKILKYIPNFTISSFVESASRAIEIICSLITNAAKNSDSINKHKIQNVVEESLISQCLEKKHIFINYNKNKLLVTKIYTFSNKAFISLEDKYTTWTFSKHLKSSNKNWHLSNFQEIH